MSGITYMFRGLGKMAVASLNKNSPSKNDFSSHPPKVQEHPSSGKGDPLPRAPSRKKKAKKANIVGGAGEGEPQRGLRWCME